MSPVHILFDIPFNPLLPSAADTSLSDVRIKDGAELSSFGLSSLSHSVGLLLQLTASLLLSRIYVLWKGYKCIRCFDGETKERYHLEDLGVDGRIIRAIELILKNPNHIRLDQNKNKLRAFMHTFMNLQLHK